MSIKLALRNLSSFLMSYCALQSWNALKLLLHACDALVPVVSGLVDKADQRILMVFDDLGRTHLPGTVPFSSSGFVVVMPVSGWRIIFITCKFASFFSTIRRLENGKLCCTISCLTWLQDFLIEKMVKSATLLSGTENSTYSARSWWSHYSGAICSNILAPAYFYLI